MVAAGSATINEMSNLIDFKFGQRRRKISINHRNHEPVVLGKATSRVSILGVSSGRRNAIW